MVSFTLKKKCTALHYGLWKPWRLPLEKICVPPVSASLNLNVGANLRKSSEIKSCKIKLNVQTTKSDQTFLAVLVFKDLFFFISVASGQT